MINIIETGEWGSFLQTHPPPGAHSDRNSLGLLGLRNRVRMMEGNCTTRSDVLLENLFFTIL